MPLNTVVIKIVGDTKDIKTTVAELEKVGEVDKKNAKIFAEASKKREFLLDSNIKRLKRYKIEQKKAFNPSDIRRFDNWIKQVNQDIELLGGKMKKVGKESDRVGKAFSSLGGIILGAFAVHGLINFSEHIFELSVESEAFGKRAKTVFGNSLEIVEKFAEESASSLGLTEIGFIGAAAAIGDILVPLGLSRERAAEMSVEAVRLGGVLKEFTGDQRSTAEISNIVAKAFTGEVESLKGLGIVVNQNDVVFRDLIKTKIRDLGLTRAQAKAEAIFETVLLSSADALKSFETNENSLARQESILTARFEEQTEHLAEFLTPAFIAAIKGINRFTGTAKDLVEETVLQNKAFLTQIKEVNTLVDRYEQLTSQTDLNSDEQAELRDIIIDLSDRVPEATTEFNKFGVVIGINTEIIKRNIKQQKELSVLRNAKVILEFRGEIQNFTKDVEKNTAALKKGFVTTTTFSKTGGKVFIENTKLSGRAIKVLANENKVLNADIADLLLNLEELGIGLTDVEKDFINAALGVERFKKGLGGEDSVKQIRNIFFLKNAISELVKEQSAQGTSTRRITQIIAELIPLQKELNDLTGKGKDVGPFKLLEKAVSDLKKELKDQTAIGDASKITLLELELATLELEKAEMRLKVAITGTLEPMKAQQLQLEKIKDVKFSATEELKKEEDREIKAITDIRDKRLDAIDKVSNAAQSASRILDQILINKLIKIDNETRAQLKALDSKGLGEEELAKRQLDIQQKADEERAKILTKQAQADKIAALINATINTAVEVTKVISNPPLAAFIAALGAIEIAVIAAQPIPTFHEGKKADLKPGEIYAKILESESVIPPDQSKKYKGPIDAMIDKRFEHYVFQEYMLPMIKSMGGSKQSNPYDDTQIWNNQKKQIKLTAETNYLIRAMTRSMESGNHRRSWN